MQSSFSSKLLKFRIVNTKWTSWNRVCIITSLKTLLICKINWDSLQLMRWMKACCLLKNAKNKGNSTKKYHWVTSINNPSILIFSVWVKTHTISNIHTNLTYMHTKTHTFYFSMHSWIINFLPFLSSFIFSFFLSLIIIIFPFMDNSNNYIG